MNKTQAIFTEKFYAETSFKLQVDSAVEYFRTHGAISFSGSMVPIWVVLLNMYDSSRYIGLENREDMQNHAVKAVSNATKSGQNPIDVLTRKFREDSDGSPIMDLVSPFVNLAIPPVDITEVNEKEIVCEHLGILLEADAYTRHDLKVGDVIETLAVWNLDVQFTQEEITIKGDAMIGMLGYPVKADIKYQVSYGYKKPMEYLAFDVMKHVSGAINNGLQGISR